MYLLLIIFGIIIIVIILCVAMMYKPDVKIPSVVEPPNNLENIHSVQGLYSSEKSIVDSALYKYTLSQVILIVIHSDGKIVAKYNGVTDQIHCPYTLTKIEPFGENLYGLTSEGTIIRLLDGSNIQSGWEVVNIINDKVINISATEDTKNLFVQSVSRGFLFESLHREPVMIKSMKISHGILRRYGTNKNIYEDTTM